MTRELHKVRNRVLRQAKLKKGERILDVGAGTGLIALEALRRVGESGQVVATDLSHDALVECRREADSGEKVAPITFATADLRCLPFPDGSFDAVFTRSVLIFLEDKPAGIRELYRVLRPGGRASIFEPINEVAERMADKLRASGHHDDLQPEWGEVQAYYDEHKGDWWGTLVGWDERQLCDWFAEAGFSSVTMSFEYSRGSSTEKRKKADVALGITARPNPNTPSYEEVARAALGDRADDYLERFARFQLIPRSATSASAVVYLVARR